MLWIEGFQGRGAPARSIDRCSYHHFRTCADQHPCYELSLAICTLCEKIAPEHLRRQDFGAHCLLLRSVHDTRCSGDIRPPLFPCYLFARSILRCGGKLSPFYPSSHERELNGEIQCTKPSHIFGPYPETNCITVRFPADFALQRQAKASQQAHPG
jgi:hypothetical protein